MLIDNLIEITISCKNVEYYHNLNYDIPLIYNKEGKLTCKKNTKINVKSCDITNYSSYDLDVKCDYCQSEFKMKAYNRFKIYDKGIIKKDACKNCINLKREESVKHTYGVDNVMHIEENKQKIFKTNINKYGTKTPLGNDMIKNKLKQTNLNKYGHENPTQCKEIQEKIKKTCLLKYGTSCVLQNNDIKIKIKNTLLRLYNVDNPCKSKIIMNKVKKTNLLKYGHECVLQNDVIKNKSMQSLYLNGTMTCSKQQKYIWEIIGGKLNYPVSKLYLDIAFPDEHIYIEYNGGGHDLSVKLKNQTAKEFEIKEIKRYKYLKSIGWKQIKIISDKDYVPLEKELIILINKAKLILLNSDKSHVVITLDKKENNNLIKL